MAEPAEAMPASLAALHADAAAELERWHAPTPSLADVAQRMRQVLADDPTAMWRGHSRVHFTASTIVLTPDLTQVALTLHGKAKRWFQFGGHFEAGDASVSEAALREAREESGLEELDLIVELLTIDAHELGSAFGHCAEHLDLRFVAVAPSPEQLVRSDESDDVAWWRIDALPEDAETSLIDAISMAVTRARAAGYGA